jgi:hypothetical protein
MIRVHSGLELLDESDDLSIVRSTPLITIFGEGCLPFSEGLQIVARPVLTLERDCKPVKRLVRAKQQKTARQSLSSVDLGF